MGEIEKLDVSEDFNTIVVKFKRLTVQGHDDIKAMRTEKP